MKRHRVKLKSRIGLGRRARNILGPLRTDAKTPVSIISMEKFAPGTIYQNPQREIRGALLNAECRKAEAEALSKRHFIL